MPKMALLDCEINENSYALLMEDGALAFFFRPRPGGFAAEETSGICHPGKKNANARGQPRRGGGGGKGGWAQLELSDVLHEIYQILIWVQ